MELIDSGEEQPKSKLKKIQVEFFFLIVLFLSSPIRAEEKQAIRQRLLQFLDEPSRKVKTTTIIIKICIFLKQKSIAYCSKCSHCISNCTH